MIRTDGRLDAFEPLDSGLGDAQWADTVLKSVVQSVEARRGREAVMLDAAALRFASVSGRLWGEFFGIPAISGEQVLQEVMDELSSTASDTKLSDEVIV